ncbi:MULTISPECIES: DUF7541 family protein [Haloarcula]|uniref:Cox cluster protein n=1 Tax=Haloarcula pellucida TaxID=1427151 RepID=A0A830GNH6_9EURY|nr:MULTISPECIES: hypothetical protein [Halomicroarcula]MBX0348028.1 hypothetical protein [Halomicroarcula pellucida]MDS0277872.1 hypothetical protein [Halomicroarcula sp. S1AR25-4]GGN96575.1 hypothetical protein GCM10009030_25000 [Halomicroarcula pellucida]
MEEQPGLSDQYRMSSPWPVFVALGLALSEIGVFIGLFPVAVFGLILFGGSIAGILTESGYATRPWPTLVGVGVLLVLLAALVAVLQLPTSAFTLANVGEGPLFTRLVAVVVAGAVMVAMGGAGSVVEQTKV